MSTAVATLGPLVVLPCEARQAKALPGRTRLPSRMRRFACLGETATADHVELNMSRGLTRVARLTFAQRRTIHEPRCTEHTMQACSGPDASSGCAGRPIRIEEVRLHRLFDGRGPSAGRPAESGAGWYQRREATHHILREGTQGKGIC